MRTTFSAALASLSSLVALLHLQPPVFAQRLTLGVIGGTSLTGDVRTGSETFPGFSESGSVTFSYSPVSRPFIVDPKLGLDLPGPLSFEVDALYRPLRARFTQAYNPPIVFPTGSIFRRLVR